MKCDIKLYLSRYARDLLAMIFAVCAIDGTCRAENAAPSIHLSFNFSAADAKLKMHDVKIMQSAPASYFEVNWFNQGYAGLQHTPAGDYGTPYIFLSSLWDTNTAAGLLSAVDFKRPDTFASRFGGEGDGWKTIYPQLWRPDVWYTVVQRAWITDKRLVVATFLRDGSTGTWVHTATLATPTSGATLLYSYNDSFLENWDGTNVNWDGRFVRKAAFRECWIQTANGAWESPRGINFSANDSAADRQRNGIYHNSFNCYLDTAENAYVMQHGGDTKPSAGFGTARTLALPLSGASRAAPVLDQIMLSSFRTSASSGRITLSWVLEGRSSPLWKTDVTVVDSAGGAVANAALIDPEMRSWSSATVPDGNYRVRLALTDIFGQVVTPVDFVLRIAGGTAPAVVLSTYGGAYYGATSVSGSWGMYVRPDGTGVFVGVGGTTATTIVANVAINTDGTFSSASPIVSGRINGGQVTGQMGSSNQSFTGNLDAGAGSPATAAYYRADGLNGAAGTTHVVTGPSGRILAVTVTPTGVDSLTGVVSASGILAGTSTAGAQSVVTLENSNQSVWVQSTTTGANPVLTSYGGLLEGVSNTTRLANLSVRAASGSGSQVLGMGFVISGSGTKPVMIRGIGPALAPFGVTGYLTNPQLTVFDSSSKPIATNAGWGGSTTLANAFTQVGAFPLSDPKSADAVLQLNLSAGTYTAQCSGNGNTTGVALVEAYDMGTTGTSRLTNVSVRTQVGTGGNILITGFFNPGNGPKQMLIRAIGPSLAQFGVTGVLAKPKLELHTLVNQKDAVIASNTGWGGTQVLADAFGKVGAFALPANSADAALLVLLHPGLVTVQVSGADGGTGVALAEIYEAP